MQGRRGPRWIELAESNNGALGRQAFDLNAALAQTVQRRGVRTHLSRCPRADDQPLGKLVQHVLEILEHERMAVPAPPVGDDAMGEHDHIAGHLAPLDDDVPEPVVA